MSDTLSELFRPQVLGTLVERYADQADETSYIDVYEEGEKIQANVDGTFKWDELRYSRDMAPIATQDSPSTSAPKLGRRSRTGQVFVIQEHVDLPARFLAGWRAPGQEGANAAMVIRQELENLTGKVMRTKNYWAAKSMTTQGGVVDLSAIPHSLILSGSLTYPVKDIDSASSWVVAATKIRSVEINSMRKTYHQAAGFKAKRAIASKAIEGYITGNAEVSNYINGSTLGGQILGRSFEEGGIGDVIPFGGIDWLFAEDYYALDSAEDTPVDVVSDADVFTLLPDRSMSQGAFAIAEGVHYVPTGVTVGEVLAAPGNVIRPVRGLGAYVSLMSAPVGIRLHVFWNGSLIQKMPNAVGAYDASP